VCVGLCVWGGGGARARVSECSFQTTNIINIPGASASACACACACVSVRYMGECAEVNVCL